MQIFEHIFMILDILSYKNERIEQQKVYNTTYYIVIGLILGLFSFYPMVILW